MDFHHIKFLSHSIQFLTSSEKAKYQEMFLQKGSFYQKTNIKYFHKTLSKPEMN